MNEVKGDIWEAYEKSKDSWIVVTTNGFVKNNRELVMGRGIALEAKERFPYIAKKLGILVELGGNNLYTFKEYRMFSFPTKHHFKDNSDLELIKKSFKSLIKYVLADKVITGNILIPRVGCGNGNLNWEDIVNIIPDEIKNSNKCIFYYN